MTKFYTDCSDCQESFQVSEFVYNYLKDGGTADVLCGSCERELWWAEEMV